MLMDSCRCIAIPIPLDKDLFERAAVKYKIRRESLRISLEVMARDWEKAFVGIGSEFQQSAPRWTDEDVRWGNGSTRNRCD
jgi:hypothetical protein